MEDVTPYIINNAKNKGKGIILTHEEKEAVRLLSELIGFEPGRICFFVVKVGLKGILDNPSVIGCTPAQERKIHDLKKLLSLMKGEYENA